MRTSARCNLISSNVDGASARWRLRQNALSFGALYRFEFLRPVSTESTGAKYRAAFNLKSDHPLVTPSYAAKRSELAKSLGLGRKAGMKVPARKKTGTRRAAAKNAA